MDKPLQPLLHSETVVLRAPTQIWSSADGSIGAMPIHGLYFCDVRLVSAQSITIDSRPLEALTVVERGPDCATFVALARQLDDPSPDPGVRVEQSRTATTSGVEERLVISSRLGTAIPATIRVDYVADASPMDAVKAGLADPRAAVHTQVDRDAVRWSGHQVSVELRAPGATLGAGSLEWAVTVPAAGSVQVQWSIRAADAIAVVSGCESPAPWSVPSVTSGDDRLARWVDRSLGDLDALRLSPTAEPGRQFLAAGAPWFFTLFGRDAIWSARFLLPLGTELAGDTLAILARLQGSSEVLGTAEEPGKIMHELRRVALEIPGEGIQLPPLYFGTVDATPLWICLLYDAWLWGLPDEQVRALLPQLRRALEWMRDHGDADGDGLLEYVDKSGRGLANQGWKDSGDSVQWHDGRLAAGPIALVEVQAYAYEAAIHGAELLEAFGDDGTPWRHWAARLRGRFHESFWIEDSDGPYLAIALDAQKRPVDTLTSNLGHVLGTGILDQRQAAIVAARLVSAPLNSGYGLRTMSTDSAGYWPLSYHGGSVWTHDTAIAIAGLVREGFPAEAAQLIEGLIAAAAGFDYRIPELYSGDPASGFSRVVPYPAACRPQAWSAASAISVLSSALALRPDGEQLSVNPGPAARSVTVDGLRFRGRTGGIRTSDSGEVVGGTGLALVVG